MKKTIYILIALLLTISLFTGCNNNNQGEAVNNGTESTYTPYEYTFRDLPAPVYHEVADAFAGGDGTAQNPYQISNAQELALLSNLLNENETGKEYYDANYVLTTDITLNDVSTEDWYLAENVYSWNPIGRGREFEGVFDGNGYTIYGLYINTNHDGEKDTYDEEYGLFGSLYGAVRNLKVESAYISVSGNSAAVGTIAGETYFEALIEYCNASAVLESYDCTVGGIVGSFSDGIIKDCQFSGSIVQIKERSVSMLGGIAGSSDGKILNCTNYAQIDFSAESINNAGGIAGYVSDGKISNCQNEGALNCTMTEDIGLTLVGGIAGDIFVSNVGGEYRSKGVVVENCQNNAPIVGSYRAGGIAGCANNDHSEYEILIENCTNNANVVARDSIGGIVGSMDCGGADAKNYNIYIKDCVNNANLQGNMVGGIIGSSLLIQGKVTIKGCKNTGEITGEELYAAGIIAYNNIMINPDIQIEILNCENTGAVFSPAHAAGIMTYICALAKDDNVNDSAVRIKECTNTGEISNSQLGFIGGICGCLGVANIPCEFLNCTNTGTLSVLTPPGDLETFESEVEFALARCAGGIIGRVGYGIYFTTDTDKGSVENVQIEDGFLKIKNCHNKGVLNVPIKAEMYTDFFGGIIGNASGEKEYSFFVEDCTYMHFDRGLGNTDFPDVGDKVD